MAKSPKRKDYLKDYTRGSDGRYSYGGKNYKFDGTEQERLEAYKKMIALAVLLIASVILSGCIDAAGRPLSWPIYMRCIIQPRGERSRQFRLMQVAI